MTTRTGSLVITPLDPRIRWWGLCDTEPHGDLVAAWRVPARDAELYFPTGGVRRAAMTSGVRLSFVTDADSFRFRCLATPPLRPSNPPETAYVDVVCDGSLHTSVPLEGTGDLEVVAVAGLPRGLKCLELWLPNYFQTKVGAFEFEDGATVLTDERILPRWVHFGGSASQGRGSGTPARMFMAGTALDRGSDLLSLSFGGSCLLQPLFAGLVASTPSDLISVHVGANIYNYSAMNRALIHSSMIGFVERVREQNPGTPMVIISPMFAPLWEVEPNLLGLTQKDVREEITACVHRLVDRGDEHLYHLNGLDLFGAEDAEMLLEPAGQEQMHPDPAGHALITRRLVGALDAIAPRQANKIGVGPAAI